MPETMTSQAQFLKKTALMPERKYKCEYCARAFSRSEHRSRHERSHTKERPFKCLKCRSTFVRRDLLLRHDRTVHAKDGGIPLHSEGKRRSNKNSSAAGPSKPTISIEPAIEPFDGNDGLVDMETAAVLMTELHQAAAAAMVDQEQMMLRENPRRSMSSDFDPSVPYTPGAIRVDNMSTWDPPTPSSTNTLPDIPRTSDSQDWNANTLQLPGHPTSMERSFSAEPPRSYASSPNPYFSGFASPSGLPTHSTPPPLPPTVENDEQRNMILNNIKEMDKERAVLDRFRLPSKSGLNRYLREYFNLFHHHFPFLHMPTFEPSTIDPPLLLAVLSVGALYTFEKEQAYTLHLSSKVLVNNFLHRNQEFSSLNCPLWTTQTLLLNMVFASWSGDAKGVEWAWSIGGLLSNVVAGGRCELQQRIEKRGDKLPTRQEWIDDEGSRRTYFAVYIFFGLLTLTFNYTSPITPAEFGSIPISLPCSETLWNSPVADDTFWREAYINEPLPSFADAHARLFSCDTPSYSAFAARVMINTLFLEVWNTHHTSSVAPAAIADYRNKLAAALATWHRSLDSVTSETMIVPLSSPQKGHPLIFNALALYRVTSARLSVDFEQIQRALREHIPEEVASLMTAATDAVDRSPQMTAVIQLCFECFQIPALMGIRWVARTAALNWSVEHPLAGFDLMLILSLWLYKIEDEMETMPPNEEERDMFEKIRALFDDDSVELYGSRLSAAVARVWGGMLDDVVVWGITSILGESFKIHSHTLALNDDSGLTLSSSASSPSSSPEMDEDLLSDAE
ncbi:fungal-specific transcription factor domain-containing protein [Pyronema domesticum]|uniref:Similar to Transcription factor steA acc. no. O74252 n=1 Tax=Pyronema omphalodes (strain CBS 100304) TaxID=1076935 RepID=U4LGS8_PYROM|nr:fungal-specific transcription factor domain-containing protein [Pyronema domesticum]CCX31284.1 Similar to Transcription factor steA; acc. no. O74252 [Pyronema omphalodes CBS 100304]